MVFLTSFIESIQLPKKKSIFKLNRIGMDTVVIYMFILLAIVSLPNLINQLRVGSELSEKIGSFFYLIYFFIFHYLVVVVLVFIVISIIAYLATKLTQMSGRKLHYSILWKMVAFSTTLPFLLYTILAFFYNLNDNFLCLSFVYTFLLLYKIITTYPKRKK